MGRPPREPDETAVSETPDSYGAYPRLTDEQIGLLAGHGRRQAVEAGQILIREGEPCEQLGVVLSGSVAIVEHHGTAEEHVLGVHGPGRFLGELGLLQGQDLGHRQSKPLTTRSSRSPRLSLSAARPREDLERTVGGRAWGPGRFRKALREAARESRAQSLPDDICAPPGRSAAPGEEGGTAANPREDGGDGR